MLGSPIEHSLSPALHRAAYAELGLTDWSYDRFEVDEHALAGFVAGLDADWRGLSMTKPLKAAALALGEADEQVAAVRGGEHDDPLRRPPPTAPQHRHRRADPRPAGGADRRRRGGGDPGRRRDDAGRTRVTLRPRRRSGPGAGPAARAGGGAALRWRSASGSTSGRVAGATNSARPTWSSPPSPPKPPPTGPISSVGSRRCSMWSTNRGRRRWPEPRRPPAARWSTGWICWCIRRSARSS